MLLVVVGVFGVYLTYRTIFGRDAGVTLLVLFLSLKLLETRTERDVDRGHVPLLLSRAHQFLLFADAADRRADARHGAGHHRRAWSASTASRRPLRESARVATLLLVQAVPVMLMLFFLFPRVPGPLWGLPQDAFSGVDRTLGHDDAGHHQPAVAVRCHRISRQVQRRRAARAAQLYWRGPVFWHFDGRTWRPGDCPVLQRALRVRAGGDARRLRGHARAAQPQLAVRARPARKASAQRAHHRRLPAAVAPAGAQPHALRDALLPRAYRATAGAEPDGLARRHGVPARGFNPRARRAGAGMAAHAAATRRGDLRQAIDSSCAPELRLHAAPPLLGRDSVDEFLFDNPGGILRALRVRRSCS